MHYSVFYPIVLLLCLAPAVSRAAPPAPPKPLPQAHSHNDYEHERPLLDALDRGFCNIEADVYLIDGKLLVAHDLIDLRTHRTLESLYLNPLKERLAANDGKLFPDDQRLTLLVDFKSAGPQTYAALGKVLQQYKSFVSGMDNGAWQPRQVDVIISGNRPVELVSNDEQRLAALDGRLSDLDDPNSAAVMPLVSDNWSSYFTWRGQGTMPIGERERLRALAAKAHEQGRRLRFWGTPDSPAFWNELQAAGVDVIGTDDLDALKRHLSE